ncbi:hypothetical protein A3D81_01610 [Candidatus Curtissbacteria bacterium RIFCSPHIGHO2_02_FULL_40_17]|uniref:Uncharacterized protein n=4 Tax=Candidatus Curtissiibacteriota TaxID=1752717 RepID=A0A1F5GH25_9BACT|nr:MAG: hypothetical protein A2693_03370 [Candidatus Curtissbacteria bacterium RIFCSPHIGHO2_01_FULL_40_12]OGD91154.1 MAG: hypothetical protein A3D81_01610 [Candidatus Curtissbacteria bacterium RIFCSPHIGHO2_02_FULL_40_17]OGE05651.1 MAG: hypothetical protein A3F45_01615 [Candidatus Curtissbacteria bacterium RIFCSPHIGHO2_12_FULL_41_17]OGE07140.1 MAG: hypothetical protein A3I53_02995 [Candidatus Curtissbacteria bacterium RIFCSPLOWO2_02_FULL_40_13b]
MTEIIRSKKGIQLSLPEGSTVIIIPKNLKRTGGEAAEKAGPPPLVVDPEAIRAVIQGYREYSQEGTETESHLASLEKQMRKARSRGFSYADFEGFLDQICDQTGLQLRGSMGGNIGSMPAFLADVKRILMERAEEVWSEPEQ